MTTHWNIDVAHSSITFSVRHLVFAKVRGRFDKWAGTIAFDEAGLERSSVEVEIDATSINTGVGDRDNHLRSADFFDVERFGSIGFTSTRVERASEERYLVVGTLTLHGVAREVTLEATYAGQTRDPWGNQRAAFAATTSINRADFGLKWNQALETGGVVVGERVDIDLEVQAVQTSVQAA